MTDHQRYSSTDPRLLEILVDPINKVPLRYDAERQELVCDNSKRAYPIREGIPILLVNEARQLTDEEIKK